MSNAKVRARRRRRARAAWGDAMQYGAYSVSIRDCVLDNWSIRNFATSKAAFAHVATCSTAVWAGIHKIIKNAVESGDVMILDETGLIGGEP